MDQFISASFILLTSDLVVTLFYFTFLPLINKINGSVSWKCM